MTSMAFEKNQRHVSDQSLVSVIVPVYNVQDYLAQCVRSLIVQTYRNLEILLVDDGSTDESGRLCDELTAGDERITVLHKPNGGLSDARNYGIERANGDYIAFVDSDDLVRPGYFERLLRPFGDDSDIDISICSYSLFWDGGEITDISSNLCDYEVISSNEALRRLCEPRRSMQLEIAWSKLFKKSLLHDIRFPVGQVHEDTATTYKLYFSARNIAISDERLYLYRQRDNSITGAFRPSNTDMIGNLMERDVFYRAHLPKDVADMHTEFALNAIMRLYYISKGSGFEGKILQAYRSFYAKAHKTSHLSVRLRLYVQYKFPGLCRLAFYMKGGFR